MPNWYYNTLPGGNPTGSRIIAHADAATGDLETATITDIFTSNQTPDLYIKALQSHGSPIIASVGNLQNLNFAGNQAMPNNVEVFNSLYIPDSSITGVWFALLNTPVIAGYNYCGFSLYKAVGANLNLVASCNSSNSYFSGGPNVIKQAPFSTPYTAQAGLYFISVLLQGTAVNPYPQFLAISGTRNTTQLTLLLPSGKGTGGSFSRASGSPASIAWSSLVTSSAFLWHWGVY